MSQKKIQTETKLAEMGISWVQNKYYQRIDTFFFDFFDKDETKGEINEYRRNEFMEKKIYGDRLTFIIEDVEKFNAYWKIKEEKRFLTEYGGFVELYYRGCPFGFGLEFKREECETLTKIGDEKAIELLSKKIEGYKLIRLFKPDVQWEVFQGMQLEISAKKKRIIGKVFNRKMNDIVFDAIISEVTRRNKECVV